VYVLPLQRDCIEKETGTISFGTFKYTLFVYKKKKSMFLKLNRIAFAREMLLNDGEKLNNLINE